MDLGWILGGSWVDLGWILVDLGGSWVDLGWILGGSWWILVDLGWIMLLPCSKRKTLWSNSAAGKYLEAKYKHIDVFSNHALSMSGGCEK